MSTAIYILGNYLLKSDNLPIKLTPYLKKLFPELTFVHYDPTEDIISKKNIVVMDTVLGINEIKVFNDLSNFLLSPRNTVHDYDLFLNLSLMKKTGRIKDFTIIGIPPKMKIKKAIEELNKIFKNIGISGNEKRNSCRDHKL